MLDPLPTTPPLPRPSSNQTGASLVQFNGDITRALHRFLSQVSVRINDLLTKEDELADIAYSGLSTDLVDGPLADIVFSGSADDLVAGTVPDARLSGTYTGLTGLSLVVPGGDPVTITVQGEGATVTNQVVRASANAGAASYNMFKARGTLSSPEAVQDGDNLGQFFWRAHSGSGYVAVAEMACEIIEPTPGVGALGNAFVFKQAPVGSATRTQTLSIDHENGMQMFGANPVIDEDRHFRLRSYTLATMPNASPAGQIVYVSDTSASVTGLAVSDGTGWRFASVT